MNILKKMVTIIDKKATIKNVLGEETFIFTWNNPSTEENLKAFENRNVHTLQDNISEVKYNAINIFSEAGYKKVGEAKPIKKFGQDENVIVVSYSKDDYMAKKHKKLFSFFSKF